MGLNLRDDASLLNELAALAGVKHVVVLGDDGLVRETTTSIGRNTADRLAAVCSALFSCGQGICYGLGQSGAVPRVVVELPAGHLLACQGGAGARAAVITHPDADVEAVTSAIRPLVDGIKQKATACSQC